jgi:hypothetical protein
MRLHLINPSNLLLRLVGNLSCSNNSRVDGRTYADFQRQRRHFSGINPMQLQTQA